MIADQLLERVELMHSRHLIHRDIKPANFVTGGSGGNANCVYCIDFGLSKRYRHPRTLQHIPQREGRSLTGTPRYASINNHLGVEQSRRDDLESIGYVLIYFLRGGLPWQGLKAKSASKKYKLIMEKKQSVTITALCQGCPSQFAEYLAYCRSLKFEAKPNIAYLRGMFRDLFRSQGYTSTNSALDWDWNRVDNQGPIKEPTNPNNIDQNNDVEMIGDGGGGNGREREREREARPDTAAAVGRPDTAAAIRPDTSGTNGGNRRTSAPSGYYETSDIPQLNSGAGGGGAQQKPLSPLGGPSGGPPSQTHCTRVAGDTEPIPRR